MLQLCHLMVREKRFMGRTTRLSKCLRLSRPKSAQIALGYLSAIGLLVSVSHPATAQEATTTPQQIFEDQNRDPFSNRGGDQAGGVMDLVHRAMQAGSLSNEDFYNQQKENLDSAAADFRAAQQRRLNGQPSTPPTPVAPTAVPTTPTK